MSFFAMLSAAFPPTIFILLAVCAVMCAIGFYKFVYFISIGYGLAIMGAGVTILIMFRSNLTLGAVLMCVLFILYGIRLSGFLLFRELKSLTYRKTMKEITRDNKTYPIYFKILIWITVALLYTAQVSPVFYRLTNGTASGVALYIAPAVMLIALITETVADLQKSAAKKVNPHRFCDSGLYKFVRCPNYFGEILFWIGAFISCFGGLSGAIQWLIPIIALVSIVYIMFSSAKRLEIRQDKNYGKDAKFVSYKNKTPIIIPFIPLYSVKNWHFIKY